MRKVVYETKEGRSEKYAEAVAKGILGVHLEEIEEPAHIFLSEKKVAMRMKA